MALVEVETRVKWEADNSMNVPSLYTKAWLVIVTLQSNQILVDREGTFILLSRPSGEFEQKQQKLSQLNSWSAELG